MQNYHVDNPAAMSEGRHMINTTRESTMQTKDVTITSAQIVVNRQSLLDIVRALDIGAKSDRVPNAMDALREPFFVDEISTGEARKDFTFNKYA
jgi:hypothetical protein